MPDYAVSLWPLAPGWWILLALPVLGMVGFVLLGPWLRSRRQRRQRQQNTIALLNELFLDCKKEGDVSLVLQLYLQKSNDVFKRVVHSNPRLASNSQLSGAAWVDFIKRLDPDSVFANLYGDNLYARRCPDKINLEALHQWSLHWVAIAQKARQEISP